MRVQVESIFVCARWRDDDGTGGEKKRDGKTRERRAKERDQGRRARRSRLNDDSKVDGLLRAVLYRKPT